MFCILFCIVIQSLRESCLGRWIFDIWEAMQCLLELEFVRQAIIIHKLKLRRFFSKNRVWPPLQLKRGGVWCSYWAFAFTIQGRLLQFFQVVLLAPQSHLSVWGLLWEEEDQVNMESFGFSFLHDLAARNLFGILIPTLDQIVFMQVQAAS